MKNKIIEGKLLLELKAQPFLTRKEYYQVKRYLELLDFELGLLVNFRSKYLKPKRILNSKYSDYSGHSDKFVNLDYVKGQSLIEVLIALAIGGILVAGATGAIALLLKNSAETRMVQIASFLAQELTDNVSVLAESDWRKIYDLSKGSGSHYFISSSTREIINGDEPVLIEGKSFTRYFYIENVNRENCGVGDITENAATACSSWPGDDNAIAEDPSTQKLTVKIEWQAGRNLSETKYLARSRNFSFQQTDWSAGANQENFPTGSSASLINNKFASSTNIDYSTSTGSIIIQGF